MKSIGNFELIDHGIEHEEFFQGCGIAHTEFAHSVTGIGDNPAEAIDDCLEQIAVLEEWRLDNMEDRIMAQKGWKKMPTSPSVTEEGYSTETYYYITMRWNPRARLSRS